MIALSSCICDWCCCFDARKKSRFGLVPLLAIDSSDQKVSKPSRPVPGMANALRAYLGTTLRPFRSSKSSIIRPLWIDQRPTPDWHSAQTGTNQSTAASPLSPFCWTPNRAGSKCKGTEHSAVASCEVGNYYGSGKLLLASQRNPGHASRPSSQRSPLNFAAAPLVLQAPSAPLLLNPIPKPNLHQLLTASIDLQSTRPSIRLLDSIPSFARSPSLPFAYSPRNPRYRQSPFSPPGE